MAELVKKFDVHANQITDWKKQLLDRASDVFGKGAKKAEVEKEDILQLAGTIDSQVNSLKRSLDKVARVRGGQGARHKAAMAALKAFDTSWKAYKKGGR